MTADLIFTGGTILTTSRTESGVHAGTHEALAVAGGRIQALGTDGQIAALRGPGTEVVDLAGRTLMPGLIETHIHLVMFGLTLGQISCRPSAVSSLDEITARVRAAAEAAGPGEWITGFGWDESGLTEGRGPTRADLDAVAPDHPVLLTRTCGHMGVVNTAALRASGIDEDAADPPGGALVRDGAGRLTGLIQETGLDLLAVPAPSPADIEAAIDAAQRAFLSYGITTVHDLAAQGAHLRAVARLRQTGGLRMRLRPWLWADDSHGMPGALDDCIGAGVTSGFGDDWVRIQGIKFMLDGSVGGLTAAVAEPYEGTDQTGILVADAAAAHPRVLAAVSSGLRAAIHGIGDRAVETAAAVLDRVAAEVPEVAEMRCRIEHCGLPRAADLEIMRRLGIIAGSSVGFLHLMGDRYLEVLGAERTARAYPNRTFAEYGIRAPLNSDCPVTEPDPWHVISAAVTRTSATGTVLDTVQNLTIAEALHAMTADAAYASFEEESIGTLSPGAWADLAVFDADPTALPADRLTTMRAQQTYVAGELVYYAADAG